MNDLAFDRVFPASVRLLSRRHWTPVAVAERACELLALGPHSRVLDVGSGVGKFCLLGAQLSPATFVGVEQRQSHVRIAREAARFLGIHRVEFFHANAIDFDWSPYDAIYIYNSFYENIEPTALIDNSVTVGEAYYIYYLRQVENKLSRLRPGTKVLTYYGFGGTFPSGFVRLAKEPFESDFIELWQKAGEGEKLEEKF